MAPKEKASPAAAKEKASPAAAKEKASPATAKEKASPGKRTSREPSPSKEEAKAASPKKASGKAAAAGSPAKKALREASPAKERAPSPAKPSPKKQKTEEKASARGHGRPARGARGDPGEEAHRFGLLPCCLAPPLLSSRSAQQSTLAELEVLYPVVERELGEKGKEISERAKKEHSEIEARLANLLKALERRKEGGEELNQLIAQITTDFQKHLHEEEDEAVPLLLEKLGADALVDVAQQFMSAKAKAPLEPQPVS
eukprot:scaffold20.g7623.t1